MIRKLGFLLVVLILTCALAGPALAQDTTQSGVIVNTGAAAEGYTLFSPLASATTYLIDTDGQIINTWESAYTPGHSVYLLENGNLLRAGSVPSERFNTGGRGGIVEEYSWDGDLVWSFTYASDTVHPHHDIEPMPNGNVLVIAWEYKTEQEALAAGRDASLIPTGVPQGPQQGQQQRPNAQPSGAEDRGLWVDHIVEVDPSTNTIVWEWHVWDHLVQDVNVSAPNYGDPAAYPARIDLNYTRARVANDWNHINAIDYNPALDQILLSAHAFDEIWIIDHATTTEEAAGPAGDLLYRWGNPAAYGASGIQELYGQHDAKWIAPGLPGEGHILIFNNGDRRTRPYSSVEEIEPPVRDDGTYTMSGRAFGLPLLMWSYQADFFAQNVSGAQRLANGNTLICNGPNGTFVEVTPGGEIVWEYVNPAAVQRQNQVQNTVFRAERYAPDFVGFAGLDLTPGEVLVGTATIPANGPGR